MPAVATRSSSGQASLPQPAQAAADQVEDLADARLAGQAAVLEHRADAAGTDGVLRAAAEHPDRPAAGGSRPRTALTIVDLPAPLGPSRATV